MSLDKDQALLIKSQFLLNQPYSKQSRIEVRLREDTVLITQSAMVELKHFLEKR